MDEKKVLELVGRIYDAALDPELWPEFLGHFARSVGAQSGAIAHEDLQVTSASFLGHWGMDSSAVQSYNDYYFAVSPYIEILEKFSSNTLYATQNLISDERLASTEYYNDWLKPQGLHFHAGVVVFRESTRIGLVELQQSIKTGPFSDESLQTIDTLKPHLKRAFQLTRQFWRAQSERSAAEELLETLGMGVILVDEHEKASHLNQRAETIASAETGLTVQAGQIAAVDHEESKALGKLIHDAVHTGVGKGLHAGGAMVIHDEEGAAALHVLVSPLRSERADMGLPGSRTAAVVFLSQPGRREMVPADVLQVLHGLTPAEARLAAELAEGLSLKEIAARHELSKGTLRNHLKAVFAKTGIHRQVELVRLVLNSPTAMLRAG